MEQDIRIICLANSRKPPQGGRCIAGKAVAAGAFGSWIRPVSARPTHEISDEERSYENGVYPQILDLIEIRVRGKAPIYHQTENVIINADYYWEKVGEMSWVDLHAALDHPNSLWKNGDHTYHGVNDRVQLADAATYVNSLYLIEPTNLRIRVRSESSFTGPNRRRVRAIFEYQGEPYNLVVTDPELEQKLLARPDADYPVANTYLSVSLSEPHTGGDGACYKLAAAVIGRDPL